MLQNFIIEFFVRLLMCENLKAQFANVLLKTALLLAVELLIFQPHPMIIDWYLVLSLYTSLKQWLAINVDYKRIHDVELSLILTSYMLL